VKQRAADSGQPSRHTQFKDHFSKQAADYAKFRPRYPDELFEFLGSLTPARELAWDCATGNGQAAIGLARVFHRVIATDASAEQIENAEIHARVEYRIALAENCGLDDDAIELVTVAQALHWLDLARFYAEARRVLKRAAGTIAAWAYLHLRVAPEIDALIKRYYSEIVGPYWPPERALVENFANLPFPFERIDTPRFQVEADWDLGALLGYLRSWSSTQRYIAAKGRDPVLLIADELRKLWGDPLQQRHLAWPLILHVGRPSA
jgi:SAM-dependent methyltransferase